MRPTFVFAPDLCTGCEACRVACGNENGGGLDTGWRQVFTFNPERHPALPTLHLSLACNHCEVPACANGCPARAYRRDDATGAVLIDEAKCIGCRYCAWVCPYDAPRFDARAGVMTKCTFCVHRLGLGERPACVASCPTGALGLQDRPVPPVEPCFSGLGSWDLGPSLVVVPPRRAEPPEGLLEDDELASASSYADAPRKITLRGEIGLYLFTMLIPVLAAWFAGGLRFPGRAPGLVPFLCLAALAFAVSTAHLGRPLRAWRAILGVRTSWLSREVTAAGAFVTLGAAYLAGPGLPASGPAALAFAVLAAVAMDGVYFVVPRRRGPRLHGAEATTALLLLAGIAAELPAMSTAAGAVKVWLLARRWRSGTPGMPVVAAVLRVVLLGAALAVALAAGPWSLAFALALASEAMDRAAFYVTLEPSTPAGRMQAEAQAATAPGPVGKMETE